MKTKYISAVLIIDSNDEKQIEEIITKLKNEGWVDDSNMRSITTMGKLKIELYRKIELSNTVTNFLCPSCGELDNCELPIKNNALKCKKYWLPEPEN